MAASAPAREASTSRPRIAYSLAAPAIRTSIAMSRPARRHGSRPDVQRGRQ